MIDEYRMGGGRERERERNYLAGLARLRMIITLPEFLYLSMEFFVGICTIIPLVINLSTGSQIKMLYR
jgi:hypothetical protein